MKIVIRLINEKTTVRIIPSLNMRFKCTTVKNKYTAHITIRLKTKSERKFLNCNFTWIYHLIKSFMAVYIAAKTPSSESIIVNTGVSNSAS